MSFSEWRELTLGEVLNFRRGHDLTKNNMTFGEYPVVGSNGVIGYHNDYTTENPCVSIGRSGNVGTPHILKQKCWAHNTTLYVDDFKGNEPEFIFYMLQTLNLENYRGGSAVPTLNRNHIHPIKLKMPYEISEQKLIAHILSTLDEKIEVNNQINKTLENMAHEIFTRWFVDFEFPNEDGEPYQSSDGEMVESELGMIPKGWEVRNFSSFINNMLGGDWGKVESQDNYNVEVNCLRGADINDVVKGKKGNLPNRFILEKNYIKKNLKEGDLVVEISGGSPTQSTGRIAYISKELLERYKNPLVCTNFCRAIELKDRNNMEYFYQYWKSEYDTGIFFNYENGTTGIKNLDISSFVERHEVVIPTNQILEKYCKLVRKLNKSIQINGVENHSLSLIRDTLLPKLMSGEIRVSLESEGEAS